ncbi:MAG: hypothetical protein ABIR98_05915 [Usitatibacter sp.]
MRLGCGLILAWLFSTASLAASIRRLPAMAVLMRRRLRRSTIGEAALAAAPDAHSLLRQNNALPGNRADGFRFNHLRLMILLTPLYLWLELSFGVSLLDKMGSSLPIDETKAVEHWGRLISGLALALLFLKIWFQQCEKWGRAWPVRLVVSLAIVGLSIVVMWQVQDAVIEFHVHRAGAQIALGLAALAAVLATGGLLARSWLTRSMANRRRGVPTTLAGLGAIFVIGAIVLAYLGPMLSALTRQAGMEEGMTRALGLERQRAAKLTVIRRGLQGGHYAHPTLPITPETADSAEGKAALALFPIVAAGMDISHFAADQARVLGELMYTDWERENGEAAWAAYQDAERELRQMSAGAFTDPARVAEREHDELRQLRMAAACNECGFRVGMGRAEYTHELHKHTEAENVKATLQNLENPKHFETGEDGEKAARTYWVPIWALLFSMVGAVVHVFKMAFTLTEYVQRRAFQTVGASDSALAARVVGHSRRLIALGILALSLFIYLSENRVTVNSNYERLQRGMWSSHPIVGALAAHWTINAQALLYPFTRKFRPDWLDFDHDPLGWLPFARSGAEIPADPAAAPRGERKRQAAP